MSGEFTENKSVILIVDDSLTNLAVFSEYLRHLNSEVLVAINGIDALAQLETRKPDIILLDVIMPGIDGFETCRRMKQNPSTSDIPVIFMTSRADTVDKVKGLGMGAVDYITKPFQEEEVVARIKTHITVSHLQKELRAQNSWLQQEIKERRRAEDDLQRRNEELRFSESRFRDLVMTLSDWVWECDSQFLITYSSGRARDLLGYEIDEVIGKTPFQLMTMEEATSFEAELTRLLSSKQPIVGLEHWLTRKDGQRVCLETNGLPILDHLARVVGYRGASKDITERKQMEEIAREYNTILELEVAERTRELEQNNAQLEREMSERAQAEDALRLSEERFSLAIHGANFGLWDWNLESDAVYFSPRWKEILGYAEDELESSAEQWKRLIHPDDLAQAQAAISVYLKKKIPVYENIFRMRHKDDSYRWILERGVATWNEYRQPLRFVGTIMDLTEQKRTEHALRENEERFSLALRAISHGLWDWNLKTDEIYFSPQWKKILGYNDSELSNELAAWQQRIHPDDLRPALETIEAYLSKKTPAYCNSYRMRHRDGHYLWILDRGLANRDATGRPYRFAGTHTDISERKRIELELSTLRYRLQAMHELVDAAFWEWDLESDRLEYSPRWWQLLGQDAHAKAHADGLAGLLDYLHPDDAATVEHELRHYAEHDGASELSLVHRLRHQGGYYLWVQTRARNQYDSDGKPLRLNASVLDISEQKALLDQVEQTANYYQRMLETSPIGLVLLQADGKIGELNRVFAEMLGYSVEQLQGRTLEQLTPPEYHESDRERMRQLKTEGHCETYRKAYLHQDGHRVAVQVSAFVLRQRTQILFWFNIQAVAEVAVAEETPA